MLSAALAYYMVFSLSPLLLLAVSIAGFVFGSDAAKGQLVNQISDYLGVEAAMIIQDLLTAVETQPSNLLTSLVSSVVLLFGGSLIFRQLKLVMNMIWDTAPKRTAGVAGVLQTVRAFAYSILMALSIGLLLLLSLTLSAILAAIDESIFAAWPELAGLLNWSEVLIIWLIPVVLFAVIFKILPDAKVAWWDVWPGALLTTLLFSAGSRLVAYYLRYATFTSLQGAAGTLLVVLLWFFYSAQIVLLGAAFTRSFAERYGSLRLTATEQPSGSLP